MLENCKVFVITKGANMKKNFTKVGNSWAILFTKTMIEMLDINPKTDKVEIEYDKKVLTMEKVKEDT